MRRLSPAEQVYVLDRLIELIRPLALDPHLSRQERRRLCARIEDAIHRIIASIINPRVEKRLAELEAFYERQYERWLAQQQETDQ